MSTATFQSPKFIIAAGLCLLGAGAGVWGLTRSKSETAPQVQVPKEFTVDALKKANPDEAMENFRKAMDRTDLTDEQREKIRENGREVMEQRMQDNADEWYKASKEEREKIISRQIDEMMKRFERMQKEREERDAKMSEEDKEKERQKWQERMKRGDSMTQAERKSRSESRSPDASARMMAYRQAVRDQMQQKGIQPPKWGGGPGGGGPRKPPGG